MSTQYITISQFCSSHDIDQEFVSALADEGLIHLTIVESTRQISLDQLDDLEMYTRLRGDIGVSAEAIDVIKNLLERMEAMRFEIEHLRQKLALYE